MSSFASISTALTALQAHRRALDTTGHNIANANTAGYTRQRTDLEARTVPGASSSVANRLVSGSGVEIVGTTRLADEFRTARVRTQTAQHADLQARAETLTEVERLLSEPGDAGLAKQLTEMWGAWSAVAKSTDRAPKEVLVDKAQAVIDSLRSGQRGLDGLWTDQRTQVEGLVTEVNGLTTRIAGLNLAVVAAQGGPAGDLGAANDLLDQRDGLVTRLVELTGATVIAQQDGTTTLTLDGNPVVVGAESYPLAVAGAVARTDVAGDPVRLVRPSGAAVGPLRGGQLAAALDALNTTIPGVAARYDEVAASLATTVNTAYATTGSPTGFFTGTSVATLAVEAGIRAAPITIRAGEPGRGDKDTSVAARIADSAKAAGGPDELWQRHVVTTGVRTQAASSRADVAAVTLASAVADQESVSGVSLDEETANLLVIQRAYEGAARVLTAVDQALDTLINRTGIVGR
jgi:flagellar hook-associated protein 1 FlgK